MNKPSPEEKRLGKIIDEFNELHLKYGEDADQFIDYDALLRNRKIVEHCRRSVENSISRRYLPGFRFKSTDHARWHFNNRDKLPFWIMDVGYGEEHYATNWVRSIFVRSYKHYCFEIASALKKYDDSTLQAVQQYNELRESGDRKLLNRHAQFVLLRRWGRHLPPGPINSPNGLMGIEPWTVRMEKLISEDVLPTTQRSLRRWPDQAVRNREARACSTPPSGWYIDYLCYFGDIPCPEGHDSDAWSDKFHKYFEHWKWAPVDGAPDPQYQTMTFCDIASPDLWSPSATRTRYKYNDSQ